MNERTLARGLAVFGIGLGLVEVFAGKKLARAIGLERRVSTLRSFGLREIGAGISILRNEATNPVKGVWARVAGDVLDLALLGTAFTKSSKRGKTGATIAAASVLGVTALDILCATQLAKRPAQIQTTY